MTTIDDGHSAPTGSLARPQPSGPELAEPGPDELELGEPGRRRRVRVWLALGAVLVAAAVAAVVWWAADRSADPGPATDGPVATATVERGTISATESWEGTLERGTPSTVRASVGGTITRLAAQGSAVGRGDVLFRVDEQPVVLLSGVVPMYRDLGPGAAGADVGQLETNLAALGYGGFAVDDRYDTSTAAAVRAWQQKIGATSTGTVPRGQVVFVPEGGQVDTVRSEVGEMVSPGTPVLDVAGADQIVSLEAAVDDRDRFAAASEVTVVLPGGDEVTGTVALAAVVERQSPDGPPGGDAAEGEAEAEPVIEVEIALGESAAEDLVGAPVEVVVAVDERTDVLLVPVTALLALSEGGYGLEVVADDGATSIVPVDTGLFAEGKVEVDASEITEGAVVGVAGR